MTAELCEIRNLQVVYGYAPPVVAVHNVSISILKKEIIGLAGESGCGKSTLALAVAQLLPEEGRVAAGQVMFGGVDLNSLPREKLNELRWTRISFVTQSAMNGLNPVLSIGAQIADAIRAHQKVSRNAAKSRAEDLLRIVEVDPSRVNSFPHELSGGMRQRVMIAMALALNPELIIMDEPTTALDVVVQAQIIQRLKSLQHEFGFSVLFITHDIALLLSIADRIAIMYAGEVVEVGTSGEILETPRHPYTKALLKSFPALKGHSHLQGIPGNPPSLLTPPEGCKFHPRCSEVLSQCKSIDATKVQLSQSHWAKCHLLQGGTDHD